MSQQCDQPLDHGIGRAVGELVLGVGGVGDDVATLRVAEEVSWITHINYLVQQFISNCEVGIYARRPDVLRISEEHDGDNAVLQPGRQGLVKV